MSDITEGCTMDVGCEELMTLRLLAADALDHLNKARAPRDDLERLGVWDELVDATARVRFILARVEVALVSCGNDGADEETPRLVSPRTDLRSVD